MGVFSRKKDQTESSPQSQARTRRSQPLPGGGDDGVALDPAELAKRRARRRLVGALALAVGAVVFLPMVFDAEPKSQAPQLSVQMPDKDTPFNPSLPNPDGTPVSAPAPGTQAQVSGTAGLAAGPSAPSVAPLAAPQSAPASSPSAATVPAAAAAASAAALAAAASKPRPTAPAAADARDAVNRPSQKPAEPRPPEKDDPRAVAALEGKVLGPTPTKPAAALDPGGFAVQIGAFSSTEKVKEVRDRLSAAGLKSYTETLSTAQGSRTRVRVGPYTSHEAAEKARERIKEAGLDGAVIPL